LIHVVWAEGGEKSISPKGAGGSFFETSIAEKLLCGNGGAEDSSGKEEGLGEHDDDD
jgi:hypothetical protein